MTTAITERDDAAGAASTRYHYTRVVEIAGRTVRARVERDYYLNQSFAIARGAQRPDDVDEDRGRRSRQLR